MKIKPFKRQGYFTIVDNSLFDYVMPTIKPRSWVVLSFILRNTLGWQRDDVPLSYSKIRMGTGIASDSTISDAIKELVGKNMITVTPGKGSWDANSYQINREFEIDTSTTKIVVEPTTKTVEYNNKETKKVTFPTKEFMQVLEAWAKLFPDKPQPRPDTLQHRNKFAAMWKRPYFRENWYRAMERASRSTFLSSSGFFTFQWFMGLTKKHGMHVEKILSGAYDDLNSNRGFYSAGEEAEEQWSIIDRWIKEWGSRKDPAADHGVLKANSKEAIRLMGGYNRLCTMESQYAKTSFIQKYREASKR